MALTPKQAQFAREYLVDLNATQAATRAGFSKKTAYSAGQRLLKNVGVAALISAGQAKRAAKLEVKSDDVLRELQTFGHLDPALLFDENGAFLPLSKMPEHVRRAISSIEVEELFADKGVNRILIGYLKKVKFWDKPKGLELLGKHISLFGESADATVTNVFQVTKNELTINLDYSRLSVDEHRTLVTLLEKATPAAPKT